MGHKHLVLIDLLTSSGWIVENRETSDLEWWADEMWMIRSTWHPTDFKLFLTFLVDPQHEGNRAKDEAVWALGVSKERPVFNPGAEILFEVSLKSKFERRIKKFVEDIGRLRNDAA